MCQGVNLLHFIVSSGVFSPFSFWENFPMIEVELKVRADINRARERLQGLGASPEGIEFQHDLYFNAPWRDFSRSDEALRIRIKGEGGLLTYKGPKIDPLSKTREEIEVEVSDWRQARQLLLRLGFEEVGEVKKWRERYEIGGFTVSLDRVEGLGEFVEVE
ncbi:MAG: class IV adenylate cyclase, partial [Deltaproteobacteria bacterium]